MGYWTVTEQDRVANGEWKRVKGTNAGLKRTR